jgi:hypothetical protein
MPGMHIPPAAPIAVPVAVPSCPHAGLRLKVCSICRCAAEAPVCSGSRCAGICGTATVTAGAW